MHNGRLFTIVGAGITVVGLIPRSMRTAGEGLLPTLSQTGAGFPDGVPTIWGSFAVWAQIFVVVALVAVVAMALRPNVAFPLDRSEASITAVAGFALLGYGVSEWLSTIDQAESLVSAFINAAEEGIISVVFSVSASSGYAIVLVGAVLIVFGGVLSLRPERIDIKRV